VEGGYIAYDPTGDRLHELNALGALLAELCDGSRSVDEIRALAGPLLPEGQRDEIGRWIGAGVEAGLLAWGDGTAVQPRELSSSELCKLAGHLCESDKAEAAYLCSKRATELAPDEPDAWYSLG
jgi:hypothetical protein